MTGDKVLNKFDDWIKDESDFAALTMREWLEPAEEDAVIFPPTYPMEDDTTRVATRRDGDFLVTVQLPPYRESRAGRNEDRGRAGYNIDRFEDGTSVCQIDSVGSQANRMEPIFKRKPYSALVPEILVKAHGRDVNLLDAAHRGADAIVRFSDLGPDLHAAFNALGKGDATRLAKIAPTSILFGSWDSRATQAKLPRIVRSVIRAYNVKELHRSAQYTTIAGEILEGGEAEVTTKGPKAELGLAHVPAVWTHGGIQVTGEIRREATLNLVAIRALGTSAETDKMALRRYILGLALVAFTAPHERFLREGCLLVLKREKKSECKVVKHDGNRDDSKLEHKEALEYAEAVAGAFVVGPSRTGTFNGDLAKEVMTLESKDRKTLMKQGPITEEGIKQFKEEKKKSKKKTD